MKRTLKRGLKDLKSLKRKQLKKLSDCDNASLTGIQPNVILHWLLRVRSLLWFIAIRRQNEVLYIINALENAPCLRLESLVNIVSWCLRVSFKEILSKWLQASARPSRATCKYVIPPLSPPSKLSKYSEHCSWRTNDTLLGSKISNSTLPSNYRVWI